MDQFTLALVVILGILTAGSPALGADGVLGIEIVDEASGEPVVARLQLSRPGAKTPTLRGLVKDGGDWIISERFDLNLSPGEYRFRVTRGGEYRVIQGTFTLEKTSQDSRTIKLPRMVDMRGDSWLSGDLAIPAQTEDLKLRMFSQGLHFAVPVGQSIIRENRKLLPAADALYQPIGLAPPAIPLGEGDVIVYQSQAENLGDSPRDATQTQTVAAAILRHGNNDSQRIAIANPFAWMLPIWIATDQVDGIFVLASDWLREDMRVENVSNGRPSDDRWFSGPLGLGRYAERVYWNLLDAGIRLAPMAGTTAQSSRVDAPAIGYNQTYVTGESIANVSDYMAAVWSGHSILTNGPMLRATLDGESPGTTFSLASGEQRELSFDLQLSVRDPVDYLEVIHNGRIVHSAKLDEFVAAQGRLPLLVVRSSGWALVRVVTQHPEHQRMAMTAPWFFDVGGEPRISRQAVEFFGAWLTDCEARLKQLPPEEVAQHVADVVRAREFWRPKLALVNAE